MTICAFSSKLLIKQARVYKFHYRMPELKFDLQSQKTKSSQTNVTISLTIQIDIIVSRSNLITTNLASFSIKKFTLRGNQIILKKIVKLNHRENRYLYKNRHCIANNCEKMKAITTCTAFALDSRCNKSNNKLIVNVYWPNTLCLDLICLHKNCFKLSTEATISVLNAGQPVGCAIFPLRKKHSRFLGFIRGFIFKKRCRNQFKMFLEICDVQCAQTKSLCTSQPTKLSASTTLRSAKPALTCWIFESWLRKKTISTFEEIFGPISLKHTRTWTKNGKKFSIYGIIFSTLHWLTQLTKNSFPFSFYTFSVFSKATWFSLSPMT